MLRPRCCYCVLCSLLGLLLALLAFFGTPTTARAQGPAKKGPVSFINDVAPILKENCFACHDAKKRKGKFDMTSFESIRKGGAKEIDPLVPGKPDESHLFELITATDKSRMPPPETSFLPSALTSRQSNASSASRSCLTMTPGSATPSR